VAGQVKLLLDENLSRRLVPFLQDAFPGSSQVALVGLEQANDKTVWDYARQHQFVVVTNDADFAELNFVYGAPPPIVWLRGLNLSKAAYLQLLISQAAEIQTTIEVEGKACVEIYKQQE
jgi:predicted nuclease of predicted toxin-antitoxin system